MTWGLALGGGGPIGMAWEVGVLRVLEEAGLPSAAEADVIVGTSAGSMLGSWLLQGRALRDVEADLLAGKRLPGRALPIETDDERRLYAEALRLWARPTTMTEEQAAEVGEVAARVTRQDPERLRSFEAEFGSDWPGARLLIVTSRVHDGARCVWERDDREPLHRAIAGSCTVPGQSAPLELGGALHIDGGVWSSTNADLLAGCGVENVLALSPMAGAMGLGRAQAARLAAETDTLGAIGVEALAVTPGNDFRDSRIDLLDGKHAADALTLGRAAAEGLVSRIGDLIGVKYSD